MQQDRARLLLRWRNSTLAARQLQEEKCLSVSQQAVVSGAALPRAAPSKLRTRRTGALHAPLSPVFTGVPATAAVPSSTERPEAAAPAGGALLNA